MAENLSTCVCEGPAAAKAGQLVSIYHPVVVEDGLRFRTNSMLKPPVRRADLIELPRGHRIYP